MNGVIMPWLVAEGIYTYRTVHNLRRPPFPGELLGLSGLFAVLALLEGPAPKVATLIGWGIDIAALLQLFGKPGANTIASAISGSGSNAGKTGGTSATTTPGTTVTV